MRFDRQKLEPILTDGVKLGITQLRFNPKRLGSEWQVVLEKALRKII